MYMDGKDNKVADILNYYLIGNIERKGEDVLLIRELMLLGYLRIYPQFDPDSEMYITTNAGLLWLKNAGLIKKRRRFQRWRKYGM